MILRAVVTMIIVFSFVYPAWAGPTKKEMTALKKCIQAQTNLSKVSREAAQVLLEARKGGEPDIGKYKGLSKSVKKWMDAVPVRCAEMDDLLAGLKQGGDSKAAIMKCYKAYENKETRCINAAKKKIKKQARDQKAQMKTIAAMNSCISTNNKPLKKCIADNSGGNKEALATFNSKLEKISERYEECWSDCASKNSRESDMIDICDKKCQKKADREEMGAINGLIKDLSN